MDFQNHAINEICFFLNHFLLYLMYEMESKVTLILILTQVRPLEQFNHILYTTFKIITVVKG